MNKIILSFLVLGFLSVIFLFNNVNVEAISPVSELTYQIITDKTEYNLDEKIQIVLIVTNTTPVEKVLNFSSGCQASYKIGDNNMVYYDSSLDLSCTQALTSVTLSPYGTHTWKMTHDLKDNKISAGAYSIVGKVIGRNNYGGAQAYQNITIKQTGNKIDCMEGHVYSFLTGKECKILLTPILFNGLILQLGSKGEDVKLVQFIVGVNADGVYGPITKQKVIEWQKANGLIADGIFGPLSRQKANMIQ
jgi:hypothetical protein